MEDKLLIWKFKRGSTDALERIYDKYEKYLIAVAMALLNNRHAAEDVLHDFFVSFVKSADTLRVNGNFKSYLAVCITNIAKNKLKRGNLEPGVLTENDIIISDALAPDVMAIQKEEAICLNRALSELPFEQREVIVLHLKTNLKFTQIAELRSTSVNTIQSRYRYGLDKLRSILNSEVTNEIA